MKKCNRCQIDKSIESFSKNPKNRDGYFHQCKLCRSIHVKQWRLNNPELYHKRRKEIYRRDRELNIQRATEWARKNKNKRVIIKNKWRAKNKELTNFYTKNYSYRKKGAEGAHTFEEYAKKLDRLGGLCFYCRINRAGTKDHIIPLSKGGSNYIDNIVPSCVNCNSSKRDKLISEWKPNLIVAGLII